MRFARLQCEREGVPAGLEELAAGGGLDWLQLDYARPRVAVVHGQAPAELPECAHGFADALRVLAKTLFLEPNFRIVGTPGWNSAYDCVERVASALIEGGCGDVPVSAVRGSNLLPILEMLQAEGLDLRNAETGAPWKELRQPVLAADLQVGGGPLTTAIAEGARVIVAGCLDEAAASTAAAVTEFDWKWSDYDRLAGAATAARAAAWRDWDADLDDPTSMMGQGLRVELDEAGRCTATHGGSVDAVAPRLQEGLEHRATDGSGIQYADVRVDASAMECRPSGPKQLSIEGVRGGKPDGCWRLDVLYQTGFAAEALIELTSNADGRSRRQLAHLARRHLQIPADIGGLLTVEELHPISAKAESAWLHAAYQSKSPAACQRFVEEALRLTSSHRSLMRLASGVPQVHVHCAAWPVRVPRDAVDIAVETRLAKEWE